MNVKLYYTKMINSCHGKSMFKIVMVFYQNLPYFVWLICRVCEITQKNDQICMAKCIFKFAVGKCIFKIVVGFLSNFPCLCKKNCQEMWNCTKMIKNYHGKNACSNLPWCFIKKFAIFRVIKLLCMRNNTKIAMNKLFIP